MESDGTKLIQLPKQIITTSESGPRIVPPRGYWLADRALRLVHVDANWEELFGVGFGAMEGKTGMELVHEDCHAAAAKPVLDLIAGRPVTFRLRLRLHGRWELCTVAVQPLFDPCGRFAGAHGYTRLIAAQITAPMPTEQATGASKIIAMPKHFLPPPPPPPQTAQNAVDLTL